ncbi:protein MAIN-LIKE 2-like [Lotus japonicus]|uniref:protein MAIN-LIKE 2-like n=1 Tax=Lotus japonicus TaxID=34305 RepID=UPI002584FAAB|nr:protein MAIN-LIKE 2-like [Lotus japonicus]
MTITLDDVSSLLHIPVVGKFFSLPTLTREEAAIVLHKQLGVTQAEAEAEIRKSLGPYARYTWLLDIAEKMAKDRKTKKAARAFLLRLVGMTIFCANTNNKVEVSYLGLFMDLEKVGEYTWGAMTLAFLYDQLKEATKVSTTSLGGYLNLFQARIFEYFPAKLFEKNLNKKYVEGEPRACKWVTKRGNMDLHAKRIVLDDLIGSSVIWTPYDEHRVHWPFQQVCLFSGLIRHSGMIRPYLPERVMRQFQMMQDQPNLPPASIPHVEEIDDRFLNFTLHCVAAQYTLSPMGVLEQLKELSAITVDPNESPDRILVANQRMRAIILQNLEQGADVDDDSGSGDAIHGGGGPNKKKKGKVSDVSTSKSS